MVYVKGIQQFHDFLIIQRFAEKTQQSYLRALISLGDFHHTPPEQLSNQQIQAFLLYVIDKKKLAWSSCNIIFCALKCFYQSFLQRDQSEFSIPPRPRSRQLPNFLTDSQVVTLLEATKNLKHKALLALVYGSGLRASEAVRLQSRHIESDRLQVRVEQGKGRKDRYTILAPASLVLLRDYWRKYHPEQWLFFGRDKAKPMSVTTAQKIFYQAKERVGYTKVNGIHCLRHSFATFMNENGCEVYVLKRLLGHSSIKTTFRYLHVSPESYAKIISPLDLFRGFLMSRPGVEVADILTAFLEKYRKNYPMTGSQRKVAAAIKACRTARLGGHVHLCDSCGTTENQYNSCRNRHCPKCQTLTKERWLCKRKAELLPCGYFHLVFTIPHQLNPLILANKRQMLGLLFRAVNETLAAFASDPQWHLSGKIGFMAILHTWNQRLLDHIHLHCLVPAGVLKADKTGWNKANEKYLFRVQSLAKAFKQKYLAGLADLRTQDELFMPTTFSSSQIKQASLKEWLVYAKKPFAGPEQVLEYLGRYTHKIAISNYRIKKIEKGQVIFSYRDRSDNNTKKDLSLDACEFIRRFLLHVLPERFMKIRYFGFLANCHRRKNCLWIHRLLGIEPTVVEAVKENIREMMKRLTGHDINRCRYCKIGMMRVAGKISRLNSS